MAALFLLILHLVLVHLVLSADQIITAEPGETVILPCRSDDSKPAVLVEWDRTDLESDHVLLFREKKVDPELQHPSFKNRVHLQDKQMKDGDVSLVLNNVTINDPGTYECRVRFSQSNRSKRSVLKSDPISTIQLQVSPPGPSGLVVVLVVLAVIVLMIPAVIIIIVRRRLPHYHPPHKEEEPGPEP